MNGKNWIVLFVRTGAEELAVEYLKKQLSAERYAPFLITKETTFWLKGVPQLERKPLFAGYIMVQTECADANVILSDVQAAIDLSGGLVYRVLNYGKDRAAVFVRESEWAVIETLMDNKR